MQRLSATQTVVAAVLLGVVFICLTVLVARGQISPAYLVSIATAVVGWLAPPPGKDTPQ
jgi:hypothetical protein